MNTMAREELEAKPLSISRMLVALDLTKQFSATLQYAAKLARSFDASLCVAYVFWPPILSAGEHYYLIDKQQREFRHELDQLVNQVRGIAPRCKSAFLVGEPADRIAALARDSRTDLIITTIYRRTFIQSSFFSEKAIEIARQAPCPVLVYYEGG